MRFVSALVVTVIVSPAMAQDAVSGIDLAGLASVIQRVLDSPSSKQAVQSDESLEATVENKTILGPTGELLPPALATRDLRGEDYFEWCLRWNKRQYVAASQRAAAPTVLRGQSTRQYSFLQGASSRGPFQRGGNSFRVASNSETDSRQQLWRVGGNGGGPVEIYNPFISRAPQD